MKKGITLFLVSVLANTASAAEDEYTSVELNQPVDYISVCNQLDIQLSSDRDECYESVKGAEYVHKGAINVCKKIALKVPCIVSALNKLYFESELKLCVSEPDSFAQVECMKDSGAIVNPPSK